MSDDMDIQATVSGAKPSPDRLCAGCGLPIPAAGTSVAFFRFGDTPVDRCHNDPECVRLRNLKLLESTQWPHYHRKADDGTDACGRCGLDLHDQIHIRLSQGDRSDEPESTASSMKSQTTPEGS